MKYSAFMSELMNMVILPILAGSRCTRLAKELASSYASGKCMLLSDDTSTSLISVGHHIIYTAPAPPDTSISFRFFGITRF